jgi:cell division septum initiation protein DivIVA
VDGTRGFRLALIGYDRDHVDAFCRTLDERAGELRARVDELEEQLARMRERKPITADQAFANVARETQRILQAAHDAGARMLVESRDQAQKELALARQERSQIISDGYRARDELREQLRRLDAARARLAGQLHAATTEIERLASGLEKGGHAGVDEASLAARRAERALTGTDVQRRPLSPGTPLRVIDGDDRSPPTRERSRRRPRSSWPEGGSPFDDKRADLAPLGVALIERLNEELGDVRDRLRELVRSNNAADRSSGGITFDDRAVAAIADAGRAQLEQAYDRGARAAGGGRGLGEQPQLDDEIGAPLVAVFEERLGAPIRELLADGARADDPPWVLVERIDGIVSDASAAMVSQIAETELSRAYERGKLATWSNSDVAARRWVVSPRGHRSDEACRGNVDAGAVPVAAPFPSGDDTPPRRDGCTCTTVAADEESEP